MTIRPLSEDVFEEIFQLLDSPEGTLIWEDPPSWANEHQIWSVVDDEEGMGLIVIPSEHHHRMGLVITVVPWESEDTTGWYMYEGPFCGSCDQHYEFEGIGLCRDCDTCRDCCMDQVNHGYE